MNLDHGCFSDHAGTVALGPALGAIVHQRGMLRLHAHALTPDGQRAVLLAGQCR